MQYRETDFNFVSRLMEHEGIYYYYRHIDGAHTMVLTDSIDKHECFPGYDAVKFIRPQEVGAAGDRAHQQLGVLPRGAARRVFARRLRFRASQRSICVSSKPVPRNYTPSDYEWFDYPGLFTKKGHGEQLAQVRGEEFGSQFERGVGETNARGIHVGSVFKLDGFPREDQNCKHLVVTSDARSRVQRLRSDAGARRVGLPLQVRGDDDRAAVSAAADHAEAVRAGAADGGGGGSRRR